jgi:hypothetical protein
MHADGHARAKEHDITTIIDNTFMSPYSRAQMMIVVYSSTLFGGLLMAKGLRSFLADVEQKIQKKLCFNPKSTTFLGIFEIRTRCDWRSLPTILPQLPLF